MLKKEKQELHSVAMMQIKSRSSETMGGSGSGWQGAKKSTVEDSLIALGVPAEAAEADAEGIEHHVSEATLRAFARFLQSREQTEDAGGR